MVAGLLAVSISFTAFSSVALAKNDKKEKGDKPSSVSASKELTQQEYDKEQLEGYLTGAGYTEKDNLKISQKFSTDENTEVSYVFSGDDVIGSYLTTEVDGEEMSSFTFDSTSDEAQSIYEETNKIQEDLNEEAGPVEINNNGNATDEDDQADVYDYVKQAYKKGQKIGFRKVDKGQLFYHGERAEFVGGEKKGKEYHGEKESFEKLQKIKLKKLEDIDVSLCYENPVVAADGYSDFYGVMNCKGGTFYTNQDKMYLQGYDIYLWDKKTKLISIDYDPNHLYYGLKIECYTKMRTFFENQRECNKAVKNYYFCPTILRCNYGAGDWDTLKNRASANGVCWCAAGASILTYLRKAVGAPLSDPAGIKDWENYMLNTYGKANYQYSDQKMNYDMVQKNLRADKPIFLSVGKDELFKKIGGGYQQITPSMYHAIVLCGSYEYSAKVYYVYMDPNNEDGYTVNNIPSSLQNNTSTNTFYFIPDDYSDKHPDRYYNYWRSTFSYKK